MNNIYKFLLVSLGFLTFSCGDIEDFNNDPNLSVSARNQEVLTSAIGFTTWIIDGRYNELSYLWAQYWTWGPGVSLGNAERFVMEPDDNNNVWFRTYANALADLQFLDRNGTDDYRAVSKVLSVYLYQYLVDHFGDVPYSAALQGEIADGSILTPTYDNEQDIYASLLSELDAAIELIGSAGAGSIGAEDLIYGGDLGQWLTFANSLKLRVLMRTSNVTDVSAAATAMVDGGNLMTDLSDLAKVDFVGSSGDENPQFATREQGIGNFYVASNSSLNVLNTLSDPRLGALYDVAPNSGMIVGIDQGATDNEPFTNVRQDYSQGSAITYGAANPTILMSHWEVQFLVAEVQERFGSTGAGEDAFNTAVTEHFAYVGAEGAGDYLTSLDYAGGNQYRHIAVQKWISMNGLQEMEGWVEARRHDIPEDRIFTDITNGIWKTPLRSQFAEGVFPSIWLYPNDEQTLNPNSPAQHSLTDKVFWDN